MRRPTNNFRVFNYKPVVRETRYPAVARSFNGGRGIVHSVIKDEDLIIGDTSDFSLSALISAGIDPSKMHVNTSRFNVISDVNDVLPSLDSIDFPQIEQVSNLSDKVE